MVVRIPGPSWRLYLWISVTIQSANLDPCLPQLELLAKVWEIGGHEEIIPPLNYYLFHHFVHLARQSRQAETLGDGPLEPFVSLRQKAKYMPLLMLPGQTGKTAIEPRRARPEAIAGPSFPPPCPNIVRCRHGIRGFEKTFGVRAFPARRVLGPSGGFKGIFHLFQA